MPEAMCRQLGAEQPPATRHSEANRRHLASLHVARTDDEPDAEARGSLRSEGPNADRDDYRA